MDQGPARDLERGSTTVEAVVLVGISFLVLVLFAQVVVWTIAQGMAHSAADQGARAGAQGSDAVATCETRVESSLANLLSGPAGDDSSWSCSVDGETVTATVVLRMSSWFPALPDLDTTVRAHARRERNPE